MTVVMDMARRVHRFEDWKQFSLPLRILIAVALLGGVFIAGEIVTFGNLIVTPRDTIELYWANLYFSELAQTSGFALMIVAFIWIIGSAVAYIVVRRVEIIVISGFLAQSLFTAQLSPLVLLDLRGIGFTASTFYWLTSASLILLFHPVGFISPFRNSDRAWQAVAIFMGVGSIGLLYGLTRGNSGLFQYASYLQFVVAFYAAYLMVRNRGPIAWFVPAVLGVMLVKAFWGYGLLVSNSGIRGGTSGWGGLGLSTPDFVMLIFPLFLGVLIAISIGTLGAIKARSKLWAVIGGAMLPGIVALPVIFSTQRAYWVALAIGAISIIPMFRVIPVRLALSAIGVVMVGLVIMTTPVFLPGLFTSTSTDEMIIEPTATSVPLAEPTSTPTPIPEPTATSTPIPEPTATVLVEPTATSVPLAEPTATSTPIPEPTATPVPIPEPTETPRGTLDSWIDTVRVRLDFTLTEFRTGSGYSRAQDIQNARDALKRNPVLGDGLGVFYYYTFDPKSDRPKTEGELNPSFHLSTVWVVATTGILGLLAFAAVFVVPYVSVIRLALSGMVSRQESAILIGASGVILVAVGYLLIDQWFPHTWRTPVLGVVMGGIAGMIAWYRQRDASGVVADDS